VQQGEFNPESCPIFGISAMIPTPSRWAKAISSFQDLWPRIKLQLIAPIRGGIWEWEILRPQTNPVFFAAFLYFLYVLIIVVSDFSVFSLVSTSSHG
jgi:hypothetical protein